MPSKLRKALGAVKDQTSISLAKVGGADIATLNLEVAILKATSHDEVPLDENYVTDILQLIASNKFYAATCAHAVARRVGKTRNWIVALKSLMLILRIFQEGDPHFPRDVLHIMKRGGKILNLSTFRDHSKRKNPWDYTAYVRTFALYLDERLDCLLRGKVSIKKKENRIHKKANQPEIRDMKPEMLLERIAYWQRLLDRAISTKPTGAAKKNNLVQISLYAVVQETYILYRDMSEAIALLLDSFFHLPYESGVQAFQTSVRASMQFAELSSYYAFCKEIGVGKTSEYPSVQKISDELIHNLSEFLKDHVSFPNQSVLEPSPLTVPNRQYGMSESISEYSEHMDVISEMSYDVGSQCTSLEDLISVTDGGPMIEHGQYFTDPHNNSSSNDDNDSGSDSSGSDPALNFAALDEWQLDPEPNPFDNDPCGSRVTSKDVELWELGLSKQVDSMSLGPTSDKNVVPDNTHAVSNPFLNEPVFVGPSGASTSQAQPALASTDLFSAAPTFRAGPAPPTFHAGKAAWMDNENDPFSVSFNPRSDKAKEDKPSLEQEREIWLQHQNKIISKHLTQD